MDVLSQVAIIIIIAVVTHIHMRTQKLAFRSRTYLILYNEHLVGVQELKALHSNLWSYVLTYFQYAKLHLPLPTKLLVLPIKIIFA